MSFLTILNTSCSRYTAFSYNGSSIKLPYHLGGKKTPDQITAAISNWIGSSSKTTAEIQAYVTKNSSTMGIDCSGFAYYVLNEATSGAVRTYFENKLNLAGKLTYGYGIKASNLTGTAYGTKITAAKDIKPGCVMNTDNGGHVIVIHSVNRNDAGVVTSIVYAHSNPNKGPHHGVVTIGDETKDLNDSSQTWNDPAYTDAAAKKLYTYTLLLEPVASFV